MTTKQISLIDRLRESAAAFRDNTVYDSDGDAHRLGVQADEMIEAADRIASLEAALEPTDDEVELVARAIHGALAAIKAMKSYEGNG